MITDRKKLIIEDVREAESREELEAMMRELNEEDGEYAGDPEVQAAYESALQKFAAVREATVEQQIEAVSKEDLQRRLAELSNQLEDIKRATPVAREVVPRAVRFYKMLKFDVSWSTKPQVHAIASILEANFKLGEIVAETRILEAMGLNEGLLHTRQGAKRIWSYYKGNHVDGLTMHGNVEKL